MRSAFTATEVIRPTPHSDLLVGGWAESRRRSLVVVILIFSDVLLALAIWQVALVLQGVLGDGRLSGIAVAGVVPNVAVWLGLRTVLGLYPGYGIGQVEELRRQTCALLATSAISVVSVLVSPVRDSFSAVLLFAWSLGLLLLAPVARHLVKRAMMRVGLWCKPVVVLGTQESGARVLKAIQQEWQLGFKPVGVFDNRRVPAGGSLEGVPYGGTLDDAVAMAREHGVDTAIFAMPHTRRVHLARFVNLVSTSFRHVVVIPDLEGITNSGVVARDLAGTFGVEITYNLLNPWAQRIKRVLDLLAVVAGGLLISLLLLAIVILIKLDSPGPVFYGHRRLGSGDRHFRCWKFRTMYTNAEQLLEECLQGNPELRAEWEMNFKLRDDPRVTRVGRFLRKTSLDELPQLWNVLRGEMSLVGPRPIVDAEVSKYGGAFEMYRRVTPGISGLWQVSGRSDTSYAERVKLDDYYVRNWSIWLDCMILARTVRTVVLGRGAC